MLDAISSKRKGEALEADAGYTGTEAEIKARGMESVICEKGTKGHPLTDEQKESNRQKSKTRCRVEHVFGFMEQTMGRPCVQRSGNNKGKSQYRADQPGLQYVPSGANQEISRRMDGLLKQR